ncbi:MAG: SDR family oxidoreductase [Devosia sp.]
MRIFVTGATGWVGSAVVQELLAAGHQVLGMARSDAGAEALAATGATVHRGTLEDLDSLRSGAAVVDGVIHTAFNHDFSKFAANAAAEQAAIDALGGALEGTDRPLVITSGIGFMAPGRIAIEDDKVPDDAPLPRNPEAAADRWAARGVHTSLVRLPPSVHGTGDHGFIALLSKIARQQGASAYIGEGRNHWPAVHRFDAAKVFRLALEKNAAGSSYHAVAEQGVPFKAIAEAIGRGLNLPVVSKAPGEVESHFGFFARFAGIDVEASSALTRERLGWTPTGIDLIADIDQGHYFAG